MSDTKIKFNLVDFFIVFAVIVIIAAVIAHFFAENIEHQPEHTAHIELFVSSILWSQGDLFFEDAEFFLDEDAIFFGSITAYNIATSTRVGWDEYGEYAPIEDVGRIDVHFTLEANGEFREMLFYLDGENVVIPGMVITLVTNNHLIHALVLNVYFPALE